MANEKKIASIIFLIVACLFFFLSLSFPDGREAEIGPGFLPKAYCAALVVLSLVLFIRGTKESKQQQNHRSTNANFRLTVITMVLSVIYVYLIPYIGFYLITPIIMIVLLKLTEVKNIWLLVLVPAGTSLFIFAFFQKLLSVPIPFGSIFS